MRVDTALAPRIQKIVIPVIVIGPFLATAFAVVQVWERAVTWRDLALLVGMYVPIALGVTAGFHRMLTHRSFHAHPIVRGAFLVLQRVVLQVVGGPTDRRTLLGH